MDSTGPAHQAPPPFVSSVMIVLPLLRGFNSVSVCVFRSARLYDCV